VAAIHDRYLSRVPLYLARMALTEERHDEVRAVLASKLLVTAGSDAGRLTQYTGRGSLDAWLQIAAMRSALNLGRREAGQAELVRRAAADAFSTPDPELEILKHRYRSDFEAAFRDALAVLSVRDRNLLRLRFLDGLLVNELAAMYAVNRVTVRRWILRGRGGRLRGNAAPPRRAAAPVRQRVREPHRARAQPRRGVAARSPRQEPRVAGCAPSTLSCRTPVPTRRPA
jgi:RNA polymerase sigma-70 factor